MIQFEGRRTRSGVTLLEVLVAIFIMGIGLLAILTLFPLGALSMAQAVREDRAAALGWNVHNLANAFDVSNGATVVNDLRNDSNVANALGSPPIADPNITIKFASPDPDGPGYPVFVDPTYFILQQLLGGTQTLGRITSTQVSAPPLALLVSSSDPAVYISSVTPGLSRASPGFLSRQPQYQAQAIARWFSFQDEISFNLAGVPQSQTAGVSINRPGTYTWTASLRRLRSVSQQFAVAASPSSLATTTELSVVVYASRATDVVDGETSIYTTYTLTPGWIPGQPAVQLGTKGSTSVTFDYSQIPGGNKPNIRKGGWILDTTYTQNNTTGFGTVNGYFYRVASVTDPAPNPTGISTAMTLELETPLRADVASFVIMENVITVLDRGMSRRP